MATSENLDTPIDSAKQEELLEKFDKSSALRSFENSKVRYFVFALAVIYSLFHHHGSIGYYLSAVLPL